MLFYLFQADGLSLLILYFGVEFPVACWLAYWLLGAFLEFLVLVGLVCWLALGWAV